MAVADILSDIGKGAAKVGRAALPVLERTAEVVSGEAPEIDAEKRSRQNKLEDEQIAAKASILENQLAMGQKYGTLTPDQQQQYISQITGLYSHPRHMGTLLEKLRKTIHPQGAYALASATPQGGTAAVDEQRAEKLAEIKKPENVKLEALNTYTAQKFGKPFGEATAEQQSEAMMHVGMSGRAPQKAQLVKDPSNGHIGYVQSDGQGGFSVQPILDTQGKPFGNIPQRVTVRNGVYHWTDALTGEIHEVPVTTTTRQIFEPLVTEEPKGGPATGAVPVLPKHATTGAVPVSTKTGAPKGNVGRIIGRTASIQDKADAGSYKKAHDDYIAATKLDSLANQVAQHPNDALNQKRLVVALERQASGRYTEAARQYILQTGLGNSIEQWANNATTGALPPDVLRQVVDGAHQNLQGSKDALKEASPGSSRTSGGGNVIVVNPEDMK